MTDLEQLLALIASLAAAVAGLGYLGRKTVRAVRAGAHVYRKSAEAFDVIVGHEAHPGLGVRLDRIEHELHPNSQLSLRDAIDRTEQGLSQLRLEFQRATTDSQARRAEDREQATRDREALHRLAARVDALKKHIES